MLPIKTFAVQTWASQIVVYVIAGLTFLLAGWSFIDGIRILRTGKAPKGTLGLPRSIKTMIHRVIRKGLRTHHLIVGSFIVGFLISLLESFCTGQVYVPTIMIMLRSPEHRLRAIFFLLIYNLMFILPLVVIMIFAYLGVRSKWLGEVLHRHLAALKFTLAILFVGLGIILLFT